MNRGEFELIEKISEAFDNPQEITGIGDDCAVIPQKIGLDTLVSTDMLVDGIHFLTDDIDPYSLGWKSAAVNISDIAAMGGKPTGSFLSFAVPKSISDEYIDEFIKGYRDISAKFNIPLLGGDTCSSPDRLCISVTVTGECPHNTAKKRNAALAGDIICVTGPLGDSAAGLKLILSHEKKNSSIEEILVTRHYRPNPRVQEGLILSSITGVHSMMDISDGLGSDLRHIADASSLSATIDLRAIPLSGELKEICSAKQWDPMDLALSGGEDYELLFTVSPGSLQEVQKRISCFPVGQMITKCESSIVWQGGKKDYKGFAHF